MFKQLLNCSTLGKKSAVQKSKLFKTWLTREFKTETQVSKIRHLVPTLCNSKENVSTIHGTSFEKHQSINFGAV